MAQQIVIGIDGGATHTRYVAADLEGNILATRETGSCSRYVNPDAAFEIQQATRDLITDAGRSPADVAHIVAGLADVNGPGDEDWAQEFTAVPGLTCPRDHINDVDIAHTAAMLGQPGVVASGGTNWTAMALTEDDRRIHIYSFRMTGVGGYALASACILRIVSEERSDEDTAFIEQILAMCEEQSVSTLHDRLSRTGIYTREGPAVPFRQIAPLVTAAAAKDVPLAMRVCDEAINRVENGIRVLGSCMHGPFIQVGLMGSVLKSDYMQCGVTRALSKPGNRQFSVVQNPLTAAAGAAWMALARSGVHCDPRIAERLRQHRD